MENDSYDVIILGGGLAGLTLSLQLKQRLPELRVRVMERNTFPVPEAAHKVGESTVELAAYYYSEVLGLREHLRSEQLPKLGLRYFFNVKEDVASNAGLHEYLELGGKDFGASVAFQLDRGKFENFLAQECRRHGVELTDGTKVRDVELGAPGANHTVLYEDAHDREPRRASCRWVVDATSRYALLKRKLGLAQENGHKASAAWFRVAAKIDITDWSQCREWQSQNSGACARWFSTNHFMGEGFWAWVIPLSSGSTSLGIVADNAYHPLETYNTLEKAMAWLRTNVPLFAQHVEPELGKLQDFKVLRNFSHNCRQVFSADGWFLTGEAGAFLDPFYSPGSDMIAISNTFITGLIAAAHAGESIEHTAQSLNRVYLAIHSRTLGCYLDKYRLFGNPIVMPIKIVWDNAVYFSSTAYLFIQGKFADAEELFKFLPLLQEVDALGAEMNRILDVWGRGEIPPCTAHYVEPYSIYDLNELNAALYPRLPTEELLRRLSTHVERLKRMRDEIVATALGLHPELHADLVPHLGRSSADAGSGEIRRLVQLIGRPQQNERLLQVV